MQGPIKRKVSLRRGPWALCCILVASTTLVNAYAQQPATLIYKAPAYKLFRFDEDYRYLQDPTQRTDIWDPIKYIPFDVDPGWYLSFGGEIRERFEYYSEPNFGLQGQPPNGYLLHRNLLHADLHAGDYFRAFVQFGSYLAPWRDAAAPPYVDRLDLQQAFVDMRLPLAASTDFDPILRVGRQEMAFGSQRLVAIRDLPNVRRNFDGIRLGDTIDGVRVDTFYVRPVRLRVGIFDDHPDHTQAFWGIYATTTVSFVPGGNLDLYYLGFENERALFAAGPGEERRQSIGSRFFGAARGWDWDWEAVGQFGTFAKQDIGAWTVATNTGYTFEVAGRKVRVGLKADIASGDRNPRDAPLGTFNALFPNLAYFNQAALFGPSNVMDLHPTLSLELTDYKSLKLTVDYDFLWRATTADAIYTGAGVPVPGTAGRPGRFTGRQFSVDLFWQADRHIQFDLGYVHVGAAKALTSAGGHDVDFPYFSGTYKF